MSEFSAVLVDSNVFIKAKFNFDGGYLERLKPFRTRPEYIVYDDVVYNEVVSHLSESLLVGSRGLKKAARDAWVNKLLSKDELDTVNEFLVDEQGAKEKAIIQIDDFLESCGAIHIPTHELSDLESVLKDYFSPAPPFEVKESKKYEFPDAFCLSATLSWARRNDKKILMVSNDQGWSDFAALHSDHLSVVSHIADALDLFQEFDDREYYVGLVEKHWVDIESQVHGIIEAEFHDHLMDGFVEVVAASFLPYDAEVDDVEVDEVRYVENDLGCVDFDLIETPGDSVDGIFVVSISAKVFYTVSANFNFSIRDSIDKDMVFIGGAVESVENCSEVQVDIYLEHDDGDIGFSSAELQNIPNSVEFGSIEPDFSE
ncbi:MAG: PIN domain-containing protein [Pseudomonadota bacterium]